ncbi:hypothetical protein DNTS_026865 [Danionella cerebrum]|uniref:F-actin monooxygenase n=1 Tax=Danionella cerebrum TaxID=2873325 RepID=A0A553MS43_9TELE|nr:hypothetical protein DNTS_026865 [Danionella translucida]
MWDAQCDPCPTHVLFDSFIQASTCRETLCAFQDLCEELKLSPGGQPQFYHILRSRLHYWKAKALWAKLDKRASQKEYMRGHACTSTTCLIIGAGPCGLRTAIELGFLGARVVLVEKRDAFSRNNVLHLWPFTIQDLRGLGAKKFYGKFCAGSIDHISIRQLQLMLLKVALLLGVEVHVNVEFKHLLEPPDEQEKQMGWRAEVDPSSHPVRELEFDVVIAADGRRNTLPGFRRKEFRGKLAIAITANFINRNTSAEAKVEEISGVAFIFNQRFFQDLRQATGIDLENIVYYKDDTHYFVMTAKKQSLLDKAVILHDYPDTEMLLSRDNVDQNALLSYAREAADFSTNHQLPALDFAMNHYGQPDVAMFDFTCMYASENAAMVRQRQGRPLLVALVGDSLLEPFWPMGTGIARGFLAAMDTAWMVRSWGQGSTPLEVLAERESVYRLLPQTTPENVSKNYSQFTVDPASRYPNINMQQISAAQVRHLVDTGKGPVLAADAVSSPHPRLTHQESEARYGTLLSWCQEQTQGSRNVSVTDFTVSWRSGLALCALIHRFRPDLIDLASLDESEAEFNSQLGLNTLEQEFGICPIMTGKEMSELEESDSLCMIMYLSQLHEQLKDTAPPRENQSSEGRAVLFSSTRSPISLLSKLGQSLSRKRNPKPCQDKTKKEVDGVGKRRRNSQPGQQDDEENNSPEASPESVMKFAEGHGKVRSMATLLLAKFEENSPSDSATVMRRQSYIQMNSGGVSLLAQQIANQIQSEQDQAPKLPHSWELGSQKELPVNAGSSDVCFFCGRRVYVMERLSAEGKFFHRSCFQCDHCCSTLRLSNYSYDQPHERFYCKHHFGFRLASTAQRKRPAPVLAPRSSQVASSVSTSLSSLGSMGTSTPDSWSSSSHPDMVSVLAKRLCGTPERIELENYKPCPQTQDSPLLEVPEETQALHNLSASLQDKNVDEQSSSSESDLEEEELDVKKGEGSDGKSNGERVFDQGEELTQEEVGENQEKCEVAGEQGDGSEEDSSDEGEYCPWERERLSGLWLTEEEAGFVKESCGGYSDDPDGDNSSVRDSKACEQQNQNVTISEPSTSTQQLESEPSPVKRSELIEEFWIKSAEIRKSLGLTPVSRDFLPKHIAASTQTSNVKESFYTSVTYNTTALDSGTQTASNCDLSTQTPSVAQLKPASLSASTDPDAALALEETIGRCSVIHKLSITVEGCVMAEKQDVELTSSSAFLNPDTVLPTPPYSPSHSPLSCDVPHSEPATGRDVLSFSSTHDTFAPQKSSVKSGHQQALSLPPDDIDVLCGDEAQESSKPLQCSGTMESLEMEKCMLPDQMVNPLLPGGPEVRVRRSEMKLWGAAAGVEEKEKKRTLLFSPRKSKKSDNATTDAQRQPGKHKSLWKTVFSVYKKDKKRMEAAGMAKTLPAAGATVESKRKVSSINRTSDLCFRKNPSFSEDLSCHAILDRCPLKAQLSKELSDIKSNLLKETIHEEVPEVGESPYVPHALAFKRAYAVKKRSILPELTIKPTTPMSSCSTEVVGVWKVFPDPSSMSLCTTLFQRPGTEEELNARLTRRVQRAARRQAKQEELRRLHRAQIIQRQLEQVEVKQRQLEEKGIAVEKALRGEADFWGDSSASELLDVHLGGMGKKDDPSLMHQWLKLVQEKNALVRYESELMIFARELELEDRQSRLQQELRERMAVDDDLKGEDELAEERRILNEMLDVVEQRDALVALLEEQRLKEQEEDQDLEAVMLSKGFSLQWD